MEEMLVYFFGGGGGGVSFAMVRIPSFFGFETFSSSSLKRNLSRIFRLRSFFFFDCEGGGLGLSDLSFFF